MREGISRDSKFHGGTFLRVAKERKREWSKKKKKKGSAVEIEVRITEMERVQRFVPLRVNGISEEREKKSWLEIGKEPLVDKNNQTIFLPFPINFELSENQFYYFIYFIYFIILIILLFFRPD